MGLSGASFSDASAATPAFKAASSAGSAASATTLTIDRPAGAVLGDVLVAAVAFRLGDATAISPPIGWSDVVRTSCTSASASLAQAVFVRVAAAAEPASYTFLLATATGAVGSILDYSGVDRVQPVDTAGGRITRNSRGIVAPSITTTVPQTLLVGAFAHSGRSTITTPSGMTTRSGSTTGTGAPSSTMLVADQPLTSSGSTGDRRALAAESNACSVGQLVALRAAPDPPINITAPVVTGIAREGEILIATTGSWSGSPTDYGYQWQRSSDGGVSWADIAGANGSSHTLTSADVGFTVRVVVTASNAGGSKSAQSAATAVVEPVASPSNIDPPTISGVAQEGKTLTASTGSWSGSPSGYAYAWKSCDQSGANCSPIAAASASAYQVTGLDVGFTIRVVVTASNSSGSGTASSAPTTVVLPAAPVSTAPPLVTGVAAEDETLTASTGSWSGSPTGYGYQWQRSSDGGASWADIAGANGSGHTLTSADVGFIVRVVVTASNAGGSGTARSVPTSVVIPNAPVSIVPPLVSGVPQEGATLTASTGSWSGSPTGYGYQWQRSDGGASWDDIAGANGSSRTLTSADVGFVMRVVVTASNAGGSASAASAATAVVSAMSTPSNVVPPEISGVAQEGRTLTATTGTWTGPPTSYAYAWERCDQAGDNCAVVSGADADTYAPTAGDVGYTIRVLVTASNSSGSSTASSAPSSPVLSAVPVNTSPPLVTGSPLEGATLFASVGEWSGAPSSYTYQWERCNQGGGSCSVIAGANADSRLLDAGDVGFRMRIVVTASNAGGSASAASAVTAKVLPIPPTNQAPPTVSGVLEDGEVLTASPGSWLSSGPLSYGYQWQRSSDGGASWADIAAANSANYTLTFADVGFVIRVVVTASNAGGWSSAASAATAAVALSGRPVNVDPPNVSGQVQAGKTLTAAPGSWSGSPTAYTYRWQRSGDGGQTWVEVGNGSVSYALTSADVGSVVRVAVTASNQFGSATAASNPLDVFPTGNLVVLANLTWRCTSAVALDLVKVTMTTRVADAVVLSTGCTGRIGRVEVETWTVDALKTVNSSANAAHDLVIESGYAICHDLAPGVHQDGWQSMGGARITVRNFVFSCGDMTDEYGTGVAQGVLIGRGGAGVTTPTDTVLEHTVVMPGAVNTFGLGESIRSGVRNSVLCPDRTGTSPFSNFGGAVDPVYVGNEEPSLTDPRCSSFTAALAWAGGQSS